MKRDDQGLDRRALGAVVRPERIAIDRKAVADTWSFIPFYMV